MKGDLHITERLRPGAELLVGLDVATLVSVAIQPLQCAKDRPTAVRIGPGSDHHAGRGVSVYDAEREVHARESGQYEWTRLDQVQSVAIYVGSTLVCHKYRNGLMTIWDVAPRTLLQYEGRLARLRHGRRDLGDGDARSVQLPTGVVAPTGDGAVLKYAAGVPARPWLCL